MTVLPAQHHAPGVQHFYVKSDSGADYVATFVSRPGQRRWFCNCADFTFRRLARKRHCKHLREIAAMAREAGGVAQLAALAVGGAPECRRIPKRAAA